MNGRMKAAWLMSDIRTTGISQSFLAGFHPHTALTQCGWQLYSEISWTSRHSQRKASKHIASDLCFPANPTGTNCDYLLSSTTSTQALVNWHSMSPKKPFKAKDQLPAPAPTPASDPHGYEFGGP